MDKIYSRKRIKLPQIGKKTPSPKRRFRSLIDFAIVIVIVGVIAFAWESYPIFVKSCKTSAWSKANNIVHEEVENAMNYYTYNDLVKVEKDANGNVTLMNSNTILINQLVFKITWNIQKRIDEAPTTMVYINYGSVSGVTFWKNFGPKFDIELESAGGIDAKIKSEFQSTAVNQSIHRIYLEMDTVVRILTPLGVFGKEINSKVLVAEAVIVGTVPDTYYNLEGMTHDDTLNVLE